MYIWYVYTCLIIWMSLMNNLDLPDLNDKLRCPGNPSSQQQCLNRIQTRSQKAFTFKLKSLYYTDNFHFWSLGWQEHRYSQLGLAHSPASRYKCRSPWIRPDFASDDTSGWIFGTGQPVRFCAIWWQTYALGVMLDEKERLSSNSLIWQWKSHEPFHVWIVFGTVDIMHIVFLLKMEIWIDILDVWKSSKVMDSRMWLMSWHRLLNT